jgi:hypothetical protein
MLALVVHFFIRENPKQMPVLARSALKNKEVAAMFEISNAVRVSFAGRNVAASDNR